MGPNDQRSPKKARAPLGADSSPAAQANSRTGCAFRWCHGSDGSPSRVCVRDSSVAKSRPQVTWGFRYCNDFIQRFMWSGGIAKNVWRECKWTTDVESRSLHWLGSFASCLQKIHFFSTPNLGTGIQGCGQTICIFSVTDVDFFLEHPGDDAQNETSYCAAGISPGALLRCPHAGGTQAPDEVRCPRS